MKRLRELVKDYFKRLIKGHFGVSELVSLRLKILTQGFAMRLQTYRNTELEATIEIIDVDFRAYFNLDDIAKSLDIEHIKAFINIENKDEVVLVKDSDIDTRQINTTYPRSFGEKGGYFLTEYGFHQVVGFCSNPKAKALRDWIVREVYPYLFKPNNYSLLQSKTTTVLSHLLREREQGEAIYDLCVEIGDRLGLKKEEVQNRARMLFKDNNLKSMEVEGFYLLENKALAKESYSYTYSYNMSEETLLHVKEFNKIALKKGFIYEKQRVSSTGKIKKCKVLTDKYLKYGKNVPHGYSSDTTIHYYEDTFEGFYDLVLNS